MLPINAAAVAALAPPDNPDRRSKHPPFQAQVLLITRRCVANTTRPADHHSNNNLLARNPILFFNYHFPPRPKTKFNKIKFNLNLV